MSKHHPARDARQWGDEAAEHLVLALDALPSGVLVAAPDGTITHVNRRLEQQFGYARAELIGKPLDLLLPGSEPPQPAEGSAAALSLAGGDRAGRRRDGSTILVEIKCNPFDGGDGDFVIVAVDEIAPPSAAPGGNGDGDRHHVVFERLLADLSVQFINLAPDHVDAAIHDALRRIGEALELDRCLFFRVLPDGMLTEFTSWLRPGIPPLPSTVPAAERFPWALETVRNGQAVCFDCTDDIPNPVDRASYRDFGTRSGLTVPLSVDGQLVGAVGFNMVRTERAWDVVTVQRLSTLAATFASVLARRQTERALQTALDEVVRLRDRLEAENVYLRAEAQDRLGTGPIVGHSAAVQQVLEQIRQVAATDSTVLLLGETGSGKELFATMIHEASARHARSMVRVNCAAIPATLMESELFGRERGAFTGAHAQQIGRFELADHSTIFLDEIGELPSEVQVKLLRVLEERQIERLGSPKPIRVDTRVIAATHRNLEQRIADGTFREDLFYRLNVFPIRVPPLRERTEDIPPLVWRFVGEFGRSFGKRIDAISRENLAALQRYPWPGNIRELRNLVERAMIVATGPRLTIPVPVAQAGGAARHSDNLAEVERDHIRGVLESTGWRVRGASGAAERLGLRPTTLETRMAKLGLGRPKAL